MPKLALPKTDAFYRSLRASAKPVMFADGGGLYMLIQPRGPRRWVFRFRHLGKPQKITLPGAYPALSLSEARRMAEKLRSQLWDGARQPVPAQGLVAPVMTVRAAVPSQPGKTAITFLELAQMYVSTRMATMDPHTRKVAWDRLDRDVFPLIGKAAAAEIKPPDLLQVLRRIENRGKIETAHRILGLCSRIFRFGVASSLVPKNIADDLKGALRPAQAAHRASLTGPEDFARLIRDIQGYRGWYATKYALRLLPMVFTRPGELRLAAWNEIDWEKAQWDIPAERMKMRLAHTVPLSTQALSLLEELRLECTSALYLFPSPIGKDVPISNVAVLNALRKLGYTTSEMCAHGFRAAARTIGAEHLGFNPLHLEAQLAHKVADPLGTAYNRTTYLPARRQMMQEWSDYLDKIR